MSLTKVMHSFATISKAVSSGRVMDANSWSCLAGERTSRPSRFWSLLASNWAEQWRQIKSNASPYLVGKTRFQKVINFQSGEFGWPLFPYPPSMRCSSRRRFKSIGSTTEGCFSKASSITDLASSTEPFSWYSRATSRAARK